MKIVDICKCECHKENSSVFHFDKCCPLCDKKYIDEDGYINIEVYYTLVKTYYDTHSDEDGLFDVCEYYNIVKSLSDSNSNKIQQKFEF